VLTPPELANQLSVINLCCFRLRELLAGKLDAKQLRQLDTIEIAAAEAAELLDKSNGSLKAMSSFTGAKKPAADSLRPSTTKTANLYHISSQLKLDGFGTGNAKNPREPPLARYCTTAFCGFTWKR
jgi:hypothetical protein